MKEIHGLSSLRSTYVQEVKTNTSEKEEILEK